jgi:hypothetical protein
MRLKVYRKRVEAQSADDRVEFWLNQPTPFNASLVIFGLQLKNEDDGVIFSIYNFNHFVGTSKADIIAPYLIRFFSNSNKENDAQVWDNLFDPLSENNETS